MFATKPRLALQMIAAALDAGVSASRVTGDEAYGQDPGLRAGLEARGVGYVLAVSCATRLRIDSGRTAIRADETARRLPVAAWYRHSAGPDAKGPRHYDWTWVPIGTDEPPPADPAATLALAFLAVATDDARPSRPADPNRSARSGEPDDLTVPEIRRPVDAVFSPPTTSLGALLSWSHGRRSHQASARRSHYRRRLSHASST